MDSYLNDALTKSANIDQTSRALTKDLILSMFDEGVVAIVPVLTEGDPNKTESFDVYELRVGKIVEWFPKHVRVQIYNDNTGQKVDKIVCCLSECADPVRGGETEDGEEYACFSHKVFL